MDVLFDSIFVEGLWGMSWGENLKAATIADTSLINFMFRG